MALSCWREGAGACASVGATGGLSAESKVTSVEGRAHTCAQVAPLSLAREPLEGRKHFLVILGFPTASTPRPRAVGREGPNL